MIRALLLATLVLAMAPTAEAKGVTVHAGGGDGRLYFLPSTLRADEGERVTLTLVNDDPTTPHDWALLEYQGRDIEVYVAGGQTRTINFTAVEPGEFRIVCQVVGHKQRGMEGTLVVDDKLLVPALAPMAAIAAVALLALRSRP